MRNHSNPPASKRSQPTLGQNLATSQVIEEIRPGQSIELLKELHILTREGKLNQDTRRKLKHH